MAASIKVDGSYVPVRGVFVKSDGVYSNITGAIDQRRFVSPLNRFPDALSALAAGQTGWADTIPAYIGSGDCTSIAVVFANAAVAPSGSNAITLPGHVTDIAECWLEYGGISIQAKFGGLAARQLADGETNVRTDDVFPWDFNVLLQKFAQGDQVLIKPRGTVPVAAQTLPTWGVDQQRSDAAFAPKSFDPAVTTPGAGSVAGAWTFTGTAATSRARALAVCLVGRFANGDPATFLGIGDSMFAGTFDVNYSGATIPRGMFARALWGTGGASVLGGCTFAVSGGKPDPWFASTNLAKVTAYVQYASVVVCGFNGLNTFPTAGAANTFPTGLTTTQNYWTGASGIYAKVREAKSNAFGVKPLKIVQIKTTLRISAASVSGTSPNTASLAVASQAAYGPQWDLGGDAQVVSDHLVSRVGQANGADFMWDAAPLIRASQDSASANYYKFAAGLNTDLVHFGYLLAPTVALDATYGLRPYLLTV